MKKNKAPEDKCLMEILKYGGRPVRTKLCELLNECLNKEKPLTTGKTSL